ncbi:bifunctional serine/threonine-protein kinase/glutamate ABC transporter substrate-binding protein [Streptosporangium saharense]|uniref:bifunctional serine/threonine-protein kinase/glutamate ABC transporter substrate-binding protein n=1 Tax=Streptosporangium saharense TaxID=1706840 RepID=UPI00342DF28F
MMPQIAPLEAGEPRQLGQFRIVGRIGEGGQGIVYLGETPEGERAAIKLLHVKFSGDTIARSRFAREARAARRVASFCTAGVIDVDLDGDTPYIASEYIEGRSLREVVEAEGPLRGTALQRLAVGTATALTAIHQAAIVHRDFKPDNVLIAADGPRVVDFGIARVIDSTGTITSRAIGTPAYMAPEQVSGGDVGPHTDVFAWGATIAFAATGETAFAGGSIAVVLNRILNHEVDIDALPEPLRGVVGAALSKAPGERPSADQILLRLLGHPETVNASPAVLNEGAQVAGPDDETSPIRMPVPEQPPTVRIPRSQTSPAVPPPQPQPPHPQAVPYGQHPGYAERPPDVYPPSWQGTVASRPQPPAPRRRSRGRWIAAAVVVLLVAGAGVAAYVSGWRPAFGTGVRQASLPPVNPDTSTKRFSSVVDKAASTHKLTIGMRDFLPGIALNNGGAWQGFEVDLATAIAGKLEVPASGITFRGTSREERPRLLASGEIDLVVSTYAINKADGVTFAGPYYVAHVDVLVKSGSAIGSAADLEGRRICQPGASASVGELQGVVKRLDLVAANTYTECMNLLQAGKVDAIPGDDLVLAGFADRESIRYKVVGLKLTDERYAVAVKKGDERTCRAVQGAIVSLYKDGTIGKLLDRHFSRVDFPTREDTLPTMAGCG